MSPFRNLLKNISYFFTSFPLIVKNFIKERYYLHYLITLPLVFIILFLFYYFFSFFPSIPIALIAGWFIGYIGNLLRESYYEDRGMAKFDWLDVFSGGYAGITAAILFIIIF